MEEVKKSKEMDMLNGGLAWQADHLCHTAGIQQYFAAAV